MKEPQKILFLARWYPNRYDPMPGLFIRRHAQALATKKTVAVIYLHQIDINSEKVREVTVEKTAQLLEIKVYYAKNHSLFAKVLNIWGFVSAMWLAWQVMKKQGFVPDFIHVHVLTRLGVFAWLMKLFNNIPYGITEHWSRYLPLRNDYKGWLRKNVTRLVVRDSVFVTTVTTNLAEAMQAHKLKHSHYHVLPNVVDTNMFVPTIRPQHRPFAFIHISCFEDQSKNISGLLRAVAKLQSVRNNFRFVMVGEGQDEAAMRRLAEALNLNEPVLSFTGLLESNALADALSQADALVLFSHYENLPVVIPEAFACGLPVIATRVGGIPEVVDSSNGVLVEAGDETALLNAMQDFLDKKLEYNKTSIRNEVVAKNSPSAVAEKLCELYRLATQGV